MKKSEEREIKIIDSRAGMLLENELNEADSIPAQDIEAGVELVVDEIIQEMKKFSGHPQALRVFLVDVLRDNRIIDVYLTRNIWHLIHGEEEEEVTAEDKELLRHSTNRIRTAIFNKLSQRAPNDEFFLEVNKFAPLRDPFHIRSMQEEDYVFRPGDVIDHPKKIKQMQEAVERYQNIPPHPSLVPIKYMHIDNGVLHMIVPHISFDALQDTLLDLERQRKDKAPAENDYKHIMRTMLQAIVDCLKASEHLEKHGLVMTDINLSNIGVRTNIHDSEYGKGLLFDLDGISIQGGTKTRVYVHDYKPPEVGLGRKEEGFFFSFDALPEHQERKEVPIEPAESVYQYGVSLQKMMGSLGCDYQTKDELAALAKRMAARDSEQRPNLKQARETLEQLI